MEQEDYLETIYKLGLNSDHVRVSDLAKELELSKPSVSQMIKRLDKEGCVNYQPYQPLKLTAKGRRIGKKIAERHKVLAEFFTTLGIAEKTQEKDIHGIEHYLSDTTLKALRKATKFLQDNNYPS